MTPEGGEVTGSTPVPTTPVGNAYWPLFDLRVTTPRLEIRLPTDEELYVLLEVIDEGIHDPSTMPFQTPWTDEVPPKRHRDSLQWWWSERASWRSEEWRFTGGVFVEGRPVGVQSMVSTKFSSLGSVTTGSWLGRAHQGQGLGKEMRAAMLHLAFAGLGAKEALSGAFKDNAASRAVSVALGYVENGRGLSLRRGVPAVHVGYRMDRETWEARRRSDITISGLEGCREMFGAGA